MPTGPIVTLSPTPVPTATPTPTPVNTSDRPAASGDAFAYAGAMTETFVRPPLPAGAVTPNPNPTDEETLNTAVTQAVTVSNTSGSTYDFHVVETDSLNGGLKTSTVTSDESYDYVASGASTDIEFRGDTSATSDGVAYTRKVGNGSGLVDILPEVSGAIAPANGTAQVTTEVDPDGAQQMQTTLADGSYTETGNDAIGIPTATKEYTSGAGSYTFPFIVPTDSSYRVYAPVPGPSGSPDTINITLTVPAELVESAPAPNATPVTLPVGQIPVWYPLPLQLFKQTITNLGTTAIPAACNVPAALNTSANAIVQATTTVDPVFGEIDVNTATSYDEAGIGVACTTLNDVVSTYYDLSGQTQPFSEGDLSFFSTPLQVTTTTETLGLTSSTVIGLTSTGRKTQLSSSRASAEHVALHAGVAHFRDVLAKHRADRHLAFYRALKTRISSFKGARR